jgi:hypothetical protein
MVARAKSFSNVAQASNLVDVAMSTINTDLSRTQIAALAEIYHNMPPDQIVTASLTGSDFIGPHGEWFYKLDMDKAKAYVDWLVRGDDSAARQLVPVVVRNGTSVAGLASRVAAILREQGYTDVRVSTVAPESRRGLPVQLTAARTGENAFAQTAIIDTGVPDAKAGPELASLLGLTDATIINSPVKPNRLGWTPPPAVTIILGQDYAQAAVGTGVLSTAQPAGVAAQTTQ